MLHVLASDMTHDFNRDRTFPHKACFDDDDGSDYDIDDDDFDILPLILSLAKNIT